MAVSVLAELERAEFAARERRLAAAAAADARVAAAQVEAEAIRSGIDAAVVAAVEERRCEHRERAAAALAAIEADIAALETVPDDGSGLERAIELVVAAVLGEREA